VVDSYRTLLSIRPLALGALRKAIEISTGYPQEGELNIRVTTS